MRAPLGATAILWFAAAGPAATVATAVPTGVDAPIAVDAPAAVDAVTPGALHGGASASFAWVSYAGRDPAAESFPAADSEYRNPVIPGFQPDPSIVRVRDDYYLVNSSFAFFPGLPIFHSRDLVNWEQVGNAIDRPGQFDFRGLGIARGIFAPTLRWHQGEFFIIGTCVDCGGSFLLSAKSPAGPWSDPVRLPSVDGIDPDLFVDDDGRAWILYNGPPREPPEYPGHRSIWLQEFDMRTRKTRGARTILVNGGADFARHPIWIEGPHLFKKDGWYYLIAAEGGTAGGHSEVVFRSSEVTGPYVPGPSNPILTQRDLDPGRRFPIAAAGHADFVEAGEGEWWSVFLATRPYESNLSNLGRETFLLPVAWKDGWPQILPRRTAVPYTHPRPRLPAGLAVDRSAWRDAFDSNTLSPDWEMIRTPSGHWYKRDASTGGLTLRARAASIGGSGNPSFLGKRQRHAFAIVETEMRYAAAVDGDRAGLAAFADEGHYYFFGLCRTSEGVKIIVALRNGRGDPPDGRIAASAAYRGAQGGPIRLRVAARGAAYDFSYALGGAPWRTLLADADGKILASETTNQFTGTMIGIYAARRTPPQ